MAFHEPSSVAFPLHLPWPSPAPSMAFHSTFHGPSTNLPRPPSDLSPTFLRPSTPFHALPPTFLRPSTPFHALPRRWAAEKKLQKRVDVLRTKLTEKTSELSTCEGELAKARHALEAANRREVAMREGMVRRRSAPNLRVAFDWPPTGLRLAFDWPSTGLPRRSSSRA